MGVFVFLLVSLIHGPRPLLPLVEPREADPGVQRLRPVSGGHVTSPYRHIPL